MSGSFSSGLLDSLAHPAQVNYLDLVNKSAYAANLVNEARKTQAQQLAGEAQLSGVDENGVYQPNVAMAALAKAGPGAALAAGPTLESSQRLSDQQLAQAKAKTDWVNSAAGAVLKSGDFSDAAMLRLFQTGVANGILTMPEVQKQMAILPPDAAGRAQWLQEHQMTHASVQQQLEQQYGTRQPVDTGSATVFPVVPPASAGGPGPVVPHTPSPDVTFTAGQQPIKQTIPVDADGRPIPMVNGQPLTPPDHYQEVTQPAHAVPGWVPGQGGQPPGPGGSSAFPNGGRNVPVQGLPGASVPPALLKTPPAAGGGPPPAPATPTGAPATTPVTQSPPQPAPPAAPAPPPAAPRYPAVPMVLNAPPQGQPEEVAGSVGHAVAARERANNYQQTIQPIEGALTALKGADTGRASELLNNIRANVQDIAPSFLQKMLPTSITDPAQRQAYEEASKYLTQIQLGAPGGARSDVGTATAGAASPSTHISNAAAAQVTQAILAQRRMEQVGTQLFNKSGLPASGYDKFMNEWATKVDPRAFIADKLDRTQRAAVVQDLGGLKSQAYQKYKQSYQDAITAGVIQHGPQAALTPTAPPPNAFASTSPATTNYLAMA